jgi:hypothetical protein
MGSRCALTERREVIAVNEKVRALIQAAGALAEVSKITYDNFLQAGFTPMQALTLTQTVLSTQMQIAAMNSTPEDGKE